MPNHSKSTLKNNIKKAQFFFETLRCLRENPLFSVFLVDPIATLRYNKVNVLQLKVCLLFLTLNIGEIF